MHKKLTIKSKATELFFQHPFPTLQTFTSVEGNDFMFSIVFTESWDEYISSVQ